MSDPTGPADPAEPTEPTEPPVVVVIVAAPVDVVWNALRDRDVLRQWHGWHYEGLEDEIDQIFFQGVVEDDEQHRLALGGGDLVELVPDGDRTVVRLTRPPVDDGSEWAAFYDDITEGWTTFLQQLRFAVEEHPGQVRRTLFFAGGGAVPDPAALVTGPQWFRAANQTGTRVPAWGDGLLVTAYNPGKDAAMAVLTTYGLDDDSLARLETQVRAWWPAGVRG